VPWTRRVIFSGNYARSWIQSYWHRYNNKASLILSMWRPTLHSFYTWKFICKMFCNLFSDAFSTAFMYHQIGGLQWIIEDTGFCILLESAFFFLSGLVQVLWECHVFQSGTPCYCEHWMLEFGAPVWGPGRIHHVSKPLPEATQSWHWCEYPNSPQQPSAHYSW
jgi:hypothetical protein